MLEKFLKDTVDDLLKEIDSYFARTHSDIQLTLDRYPFYIQFEPALGCTGVNDLAIKRSVYPIFKGDLKELLNSLKAQVEEKLDPKIRMLIAKREEVIFHSMH